MFYYVLKELGDMDERDMNRLYFNIAQRVPNSLQRAYAEMLNMFVSKENISREFMKARIPLPLAVGLGDVELAEHIISQGVDVNLPTMGNLRALHMTCLNGDLKMAKLLLQSGADVNAFDCRNQTPMMTLFSAMIAWKAIAVDNCYLITRLLLSYGAVLGRFDKQVILLAVACANLSTLKLLVNEANADLNYRINGTDTCLHSAVVNEHPGVLDYVLDEFDGDVDVGAANGWTPLLKASHPDFQNHKSVEVLLKIGADFRIADAQGLTSFDLLIRGERNPKLAWLYFDLGFDVLDREVSSLYWAVQLNSPWMQDVIAEVAIKEMMGIPIAGSNRQIFNRCEKARRCLRLCRDQLRKMKKMRVHEKVSLWDMLTGNRVRLAQYAKKSELVRSFFDIECNGLFSMYCARIKHKFVEVMSRNSLNDVSASMVCEAIKCPIMYEILQYEVMTYMEKEDFKKILCCCCDP